MHIPTECAIETEDGCTWLVKWQQELGVFSADLWFFGEDENPSGEEDACTCPGPGEGYYAQLETLEIAMGQRIPHQQRNSLMMDQGLLPVSARHRAEWTIEVAEAIYYTTPDGQVEDSWAPPWENDPWSPAYVIRDFDERVHFWDRAR